MSESSMYDAYMKKLHNICEENRLVAIFDKEHYPTRMIIRPLTGLDDQITMLEFAEEKGYTSPDASIVFSYRDGVLSYKTSESFSISDALFNKLKNLYKKLHYTWLQFFHRELIERGVIGAGRNMPQIDDGEPELAAELTAEPEDEVFERLNEDEEEEEA